MRGFDPGYSCIRSSVISTEFSVARTIESCNVEWGVGVKALCYKPEGRGFETDDVSDLCSIYLILPAAIGPGVYSAPNRNEYQKQKNNVSRD
jgi:hypothetical protein